MRRAGRLAALLVALPLARAGVLRAQEGLTLHPLTGEVGVDFNGSWFAVPAAEGTSRQTFREWLQVNLAGDYLHPRFLNFSLGLRPTLGQTDWTGFPESPPGGFDRLNGSGVLNFLAGAPISLSLRGSQTTENNRGVFGQEVDLDKTRWGSRLSYRNAYFPVFLDYEYTSRDVVWQPSGQAPFREAETIGTLRLVARNSKTSVLLERLSFDDQVNQLDFTRYRSDVDHHLRWGKGSHLFSDFRYVQRTGAGAHERLFWAQRAHLQHTWTVFSDYDYELFSLEAGGTRTTGWGANVTGTYEFHSGLALAAQGYARSIKSSDARRSIYGGRPRVGFTGPLPLGARLRANAAVGYERRAVEPADDGFLPVVNERHVIDSSGRFLLDEALADGASVVITNADETTVYQEDFDYRLVEAPPLLEIVVLPGGRLQVGDTVLVDYRFQLVSSSSSDALVADYDVNVRVGGLTLYHRRFLRAGSEPDAREALLLPVDYDDMATGVVLSFGTPAGLLSLLGEHRRRALNGFDHTDYFLRGGLGFEIRRDLSGKLGASANLRRGGPTDFDLVSAHSSVEWSAAPSFRARAGVTTWSWSEEARRESFVGSGVGVDWSIGLFNLATRYDRLTWDNGFDRTENRVLVHVVRKF